ncbi:hypothetical protein Tco_1510768 [Tanacetum coccineum]
MGKLAFYDYHNMVANLEKIEHNQDFHQIVDFLRASHIRTETVNGETNTVATIDGRQRTITEASIRRFIQLNDARGWKGKDFRGMTFEQIEAEFTLVWETGTKELKRIKSAAKFSRSDDDDIPSGVGLTDEELKGMMELVPIEEVYIEALQVKRLIIGWYVCDDGNLKSWKIVRVGEHMELYQTFEDMVKRIDKEDLDKLWSLAQEVHEKGQLLDDKEKQIWVELKRLYEPDPTDQLWKI